MAGPADLAAVGGAGAMPRALRILWRGLLASARPLARLLASGGWRGKVAAGALAWVASLSLVLLAANPRKYRWNMLSLFWRGVWLSLWSAHLRNMLLSSVLVSYVLSRRTHSSFALPLSFGTMYLLYYHFAVKEFAAVRCQATYWNTMIVERAGLARRPFCPTIWGIGRHAQTSTCMVLSLVEWLWSRPVKYVRENVPSWDGNQQHLDWVDEVLAREADDDSAHHASVQSRPICVLIHGLGDDRHHPAVMRMARLCRNRGWRVVVWSYWRMDFSESRDLKGVLRSISERAPLSPVVGVGWSAGGHLLLNYLGAVGKSSPLVCAVTLSGALDFGAHARHVVDEENGLYYRFLGLMAQKCLRRHVENDKRIGDARAFMKRFSLFDLDGGKIYSQFLSSCPSDSMLSRLDGGRADELESPEGSDGVGSPPASFSARRRQSRDLARRKAGQAGDGVGRRIGSKGSGGNPVMAMLDHYPAAAHVLGRIRVPTLMIFSEDDPVTRLDPSARAELTRNRHVITAATARGGHMGFYDTLFPAGSTWDARTAAAYIGAVLETLSQTHFMLNILKEAAQRGLLSGGKRDGGAEEAAWRVATWPAAHGDHDAPEDRSFPARRGSGSGTLDGSPIERVNSRGGHTPGHTAGLRPATMRRICSVSDVR